MRLSIVGFGPIALGVLFGLSTSLSGCEPGAKTPEQVLSSNCRGACVGQQNTQKFRITEVAKICAEYCECTLAEMKASDEPTVMSALAGGTEPMTQDGRRETERIARKCSAPTFPGM